MVSALRLVAVLALSWPLPGPVEQQARNPEAEFEQILRAD